MPVSFISTSAQFSQRKYSKIQSIKEIKPWKVSVEDKRIRMHLAQLSSQPKAINSEVICEHRAFGHFISVRYMVLFTDIFTFNGRVEYIKVIYQGQKAQENSGRLLPCQIGKVPHATSKIQGGSGQKKMESKAMDIWKPSSGLKGQLLIQVHVECEQLGSLTT